MNLRAKVYAAGTLEASVGESVGESTPKKSGDKVRESLFCFAHDLVKSDDKSRLDINDHPFCVHVRQSRKRIKTNRPFQNLQTLPNPFLFFIVNSSQYSCTLYAKHLK